MTNTTFTDRRPVMGGEAVITVVGGSEAMLQDAFALADLCDRLWSRFRETSELTHINNAGGKRVEISPLTAALINEMIEGFELTSGDFNPTVLPAVLGVGYQRSQVHPELQTEIAADARVFDSLEGVELQLDSVQLPAGMTLDSGGIGKGFAADVIAASLMKSGAQGAMVSMSGDVVVLGSAPQGEAWRLGVEDPFDVSGHVQVVTLRDAAVVTSSQRKNLFGGGHHLINPVTLTSAETTAQTVSVIATTGARAEVLAKCGFLRDIDEFLSWLPTVDAAGMVIDHDKTIRESENWAAYL